MEKLRENGVLAGLGLITATIGLASSIIYFSNKSIEDKLVSPNFQESEEKEVQKELSTQHMTAEEYLAEDPRLTPGGGVIWPKYFIR